MRACTVYPYLYQNTFLSIFLFKLTNGMSNTFYVMIVYPSPRNIASWFIELFNIIGGLCQILFTLSTILQWILWWWWWWWYGIRTMCISVWRVWKTVVVVLPREYIHVVIISRVVVKCLLLLSFMCLKYYDIPIRFWVLICAWARVI